MKKQPRRLTLARETLLTLAGATTEIWPSVPPNSAVCVPHQPLQCPKSEGNPCSGMSCSTCADSCSY